MGSPTGGVQLDPATGAPRVHNSRGPNYGQSKAYVWSCTFVSFLSLQWTDVRGNRGNLLMASEYGREHPSIVSTCFNPGTAPSSLCLSVAALNKLFVGNLMSELQRHLTGWQVYILKTIL